MKASNRAIPLNRTSAHAPGCFRWPLAQLGRLAASSSSFREYEEAKFRFILRLLAGRYNPEVITRVMLHSSFQRSIHSGRVFRPGRHAKPQQNLVITLSLPFHPVWFNARLNKVLQDAASKVAFQLRVAFGRDVSFRLAWKRAGPNLLTCTRAASRARF